MAVNILFYKSSPYYIIQVWDSAEDTNRVQNILPSELLQSAEEQSFLASNVGSDSGVHHLTYLKETISSVLVNAISSTRSENLSQFAIADPSRENKIPIGRAVSLARIKSYGKVVRLMSGESLCFGAITGLVRNATSAAGSELT